jgi:hypothetical protein
MPVLEVAAGDAAACLLLAAAAAAALGVLLPALAWLLRNAGCCGGGALVLVAASTVALVGPAAVLASASAWSCRACWLVEGCAGGAAWADVVTCVGLLAAGCADASARMVAAGDPAGLAAAS